MCNKQGVIAKGVASGIVRGELVLGAKFRGKMVKDNLLRIALQQ